MINKLINLVNYLDESGFEKEAIAVKGLVPLFVYGTLREGEKNHHKLKGSKSLGDKTLSGFIRTEGTGPAIVPGGKNDTVDGELYAVEPEVLSEIDEYEGSEYPRELVQLDDGTEAYVYIYKPKQNKESIGSVEKYVKHTALNLGMVARNLAFLDKKSLRARLEGLANELYYAIIPPWTHHSNEELQDMVRHTVWKWFMCGFASDEEYSEKCLEKNASKIDILTKIAGKLEDAIREHPSFEAEIRRLIIGVRPGHFEWALEELVDGNATAEELIPVLDRFQKIRSNLERDDLYQYPAINILRREVNKYGPTSAETRSEKKEKKLKESDIVYNSDNFKVIWPKTEFASCQWTGFNTTWCVSAEESNMYDSYSSNNVFLYFILNKHLDEDHDHKRISIPTKGDLEVLSSEVRDAQDQHLGADAAKEIIGEEFDKIKQAILKHAKSTEFTENITEQVRDVVRKIKNGELIKAKELEEVFKVLENSDTTDTYWTHFLLNSLSGHPNLADAMIASKKHYKTKLFESFMEIFDYKLSDKAKNAISNIGEAGLDIHLIENYNVGNQFKLDALTEFFIEDVESLAEVFPVILNHLLKFQAGKKAVFNFLADDLLPGEVKVLIEEVDDATLLYLFNAGELDARDQTLVEELGESLVSRGAITSDELSEKLSVWSEPDFDWQRG